MKEEIKYVVSVLRTWDSMQVWGLPLSPTQDGCIGFLPVFEDYVKASEWVQEHGTPEANIVPIKRLSPTKAEVGNE